MLWWAWCAAACVLFARPAASPTGQLVQVLGLSVVLPLLAGYMPYTPDAVAIHYAVQPTLLKLLRLLGGGGQGHAME